MNQTSEPINISKNEIYKAVSQVDTYLEKFFDLEYNSVINEVCSKELTASQKIQLLSILIDKKKQVSNGGG